VSGSVASSPGADRRKPARYRLYLDESGHHDYNLLEDPARRFLALLGVWFLQNPDYVAFADGLVALKRDVFGPRPDKPVVLHRSDIINRKGPFGVLCDASEERLFNAGLLKLVGDAKFRMVCVVIDKQRHLEQYASPFHPYHFCLAAMLDRYSGWLNYKNAVGDVVAEARGRVEDRQLEQAYRRVYESGTFSIFGHVHHQRALTSHDIKVRPKSANIAGLQLADILAHPVRQAMLHECGLSPASAGFFGSELLKAADAKFNRNEKTGVIEGYGQVWLSK
jgi:hypothetical protein